LVSYRFISLDRCVDPIADCNKESPVCSSSTPLLALGAAVTIITRSNHSSISIVVNNHISIATADQTRFRQTCKQSVDAAIVIPFLEIKIEPEG
jgi:hypothetical protein